MFKSYRNFTIDKPVNTKRLKVIFQDSKTIVRLHQTDIVVRNNINNVVTLNSGKWRTYSTKTAMNTALAQLFETVGSVNVPRIHQLKNSWYVTLNNTQVIPYFDGMILGGGFGCTAVMVLNGWEAA